jgi:hypothetical protein
MYYKHIKQILLSLISQLNGWFGGSIRAKKTQSKKLRILFTLSILTLLSLRLVACDGNGIITPTPITPQAYSVDKTFKEFYQTLGGLQRLGPGLTPVEAREGNLKCQFTEAVLMCFNAAVTGPDRFSLYPLGNLLDLREDTPLEGVLASPGARVVDGIVIYEKFVPVYDSLFGARYTGRPITKLRINTDLQRVEQFFENVGFYQKLGDPNGPVHLISYGAYLCGDKCAYKLGEYWGIVKSNLIEQPFAASITRLGGEAVFGQPLLHPRIAPDGYLEQVYTNGIFYGSPDDPSIVRMRPIVQELGYPSTPPVAKKSHDKLVFYETMPGLGHNVPINFDAFLAMHGGKDIAGNPITEVFRLGAQNLYQQCFENYCIVYDPQASESLKIRLLPLGQNYINKFPPDQNLKPQNIFTPDHIKLASAADKPTLKPNEEQFVRIVVQQKGNEQPLNRVEGTLVLTLPDGQTTRYFFAPTDDEGKAVVVIPPYPGLKPNDRLLYQVCLNLPSERPICDMQSYLIVWD